MIAYQEYFKHINSSFNLETNRYIKQIKINALQEGENNFLLMLTGQL